MTRGKIVAAALCVLAACSSDAVPSNGDGGTPVPSSSSSSSSSSGSLSDGGTSPTGDDDDGAAPPDSPPCPNGSTRLYDRFTCAGTAPASDPTIRASLVSGGPGATVSLGTLDTSTLPCLPVRVCATAESPGLLFSDSPESPSSDGVLYADTLPAGAYRLYVYHTNGGTGSRKFPIVVLNQGAADAQVNILRRGLAGPSTDYLSVGKTALEGLLGPSDSITVPVPAGERVLLDADLDALHATSSELVHAIYDVTTSAPLKVSVVSVADDEDAVAVTAGLSLLPRQDTHQRGTFPNADIVLVPVQTALDGMRRLRLGSDDVDPPRAGVDATTGDPQTLAGNFGVSYELAFAGLTGVYAAASPRGGAWAGVAAQANQSTLLPTSSDAVSQTSQAAEIGSTDANDIVFATAGSSSLPIDVLFVP